MLDYTEHQFLPLAVTNAIQAYRIMEKNLYYRVYLEMMLFYYREAVILTELRNWQKVSYLKILILGFKWEIGCIRFRAYFQRSISRQGGKQQSAGLKLLETYLSCYLSCICNLSRFILILQKISLK